MTKIILLALFVVALIVIVVAEYFSIMRSLERQWIRMVFGDDEIKAPAET